MCQRFVVSEYIAGSILDHVAEVLHSYTNCQQFPNTGPTFLFCARELFEKEG